jgi:hypothetical protein
MLVAAFALTACAKPEIVDNPPGMTPEETVEKFFGYWSEKNLSGMNSLLGGAYNDNPLDKITFHKQKSIELISCEEDAEKPDWDDESAQNWFRDPYDCASVTTRFIATVRPGSILTKGEHMYRFFLVKESAESDWMIVMYGAG